jgi:hypothetical protein
MSLFFDLFCTAVQKNYKFFYSEMAEELLTFIDGAHIRVLS